MSTTISIRKDARGFFVSSPGIKKLRAANRSLSITYALNIAKKEIDAGYQDVEIHDVDGRKYYPSKSGEFSLRPEKAKLEPKRNTRLTVIFIINNESSHKDFAVTKATSDLPSFLMHVLGKLTKKQRQGLDQLNIIVGERELNEGFGSWRRSFKFNEWSMKQRGPAPRKNKGFWEGLFK